MSTAWKPGGQLQLTGHLAMGSSNTPSSYVKDLAQVAPKVDNVIYQINHYQVNECYQTDHAVLWMVIYPPEQPGLGEFHTQ